MNRLGIYFFYDKEGVVDEYVTYYLEHLKPFCSELCVVVNAPLTSEGRKKLSSVSDCLLVRDNTGFDSQAYKYAIEYYGYEKLKNYDELILCNFTCYGPVYPFKKMFDKMDASDSDFWGITRYPRRNGIICDKQKTPYINEHIMSFFMGIRQNMLKDESFKEYWETIEVANNYAEAVVVNELRFTDYFEQRGFTSATFMPYETVKDFCENSATFNPEVLLKYECPIVKRRAFFSDYGLMILFGNGSQGSNALQYIKYHTKYDVNMIWDNLLRTQPGSILKRNLHLNYFLDEDKYTGDEKQLKAKQKIAMLCYCYYDDMLEYCYNYAKNLPEWADVYLFVVDEKVAKVAKKIFAKLPNKTEVRVKENRGQLASAVLISGKDIFEKYDLVCVTQAKKTSQLQDKVSSENFCNHCWDGVLKSKAYVLNLIQTYNDNPRMGYSCNMPPHWGEFCGHIGNEVGCNREQMKKLMKKFELNIPFDEEPIASYGECYWVRAKGYKKILSYEWKHSDFPEAKCTPKDGFILNALERLMPVFVQEQGFYPAWILPKSAAILYVDNIYYRLRKSNQSLYLNVPNLSSEYLNAPNLSSEIRQLIVKKGLKLQYWRYKLLSKITFGRMRKRYKMKKKEAKWMLKEM